MPRFHVQRSISIAAPPQQVFNTVADFRTWTTWSPWLVAEPTAQVTITDDASSVGAVYAWKGEIVGQGEVEHLELHPGRSISQEIRFIKPFWSRSSVGFEIAPDGDGAELSWHMRGSLPWYMFWLKPIMTAMIGMDYERGLKMLKEWIETGRILSRTEIHGVTSVGPLRMAGLRRKATLAEVGPSMGATFAEVRKALAASGISTDGERISVYHGFKMKTGVFDLTSGFVIPADAGAVPTTLSEWTVPASTRAFHVEHVGRYEHLGNAWSAANQITRAKKHKQSKAGAFEIYRNDPRQTPETELRTDVLLPLK